MNSITHFFARRLALTLLATITAMTSWAQKLSGDGSVTTPYLIKDANDWTIFTDMINGGEGSSAYYSLEDNIQLGSEQQPLTTIVGTDNNPFCGVFLGNDHTLSLYISRTTKYAAPFGVTDGAVIKDLNVDGTITTTNKFAAGFIAYANNKKNKTTSLTNCRSSVHIICDGIETVLSTKPYDCTHGGLVGQNEAGTLIFTNCVFDGWIKEFATEKKANKCTGFVAWVNNTVNYTNCIMAGYIDVKPNDATLNNSMANFHRLASSAKANFKGYNYSIIDYTYPGLPQQGEIASTTIPDNTIARRYTINEQNYFISSAEITENKVTFLGSTLVEGTDYLRTIVNPDEKWFTVVGLNNYSGFYTNAPEPVFQMNVDTWNADTKTGWYAISSPIDGQVFAGVEHLTPATFKHNIYRYNEEKRLWEEYRNEANIYTSFENGRGYLYRTDYNGGNVNYYGTLNSGDVKIDLSYTKKNDKLSGFNLIGNPYGHNIYKSVAIPNEKLIEGYSVLTQEGTWEFKTDFEAIPEGSAVLVQTSESLSKGDYTITMIDTEDAPVSKASNDEIWFTVKNNEYSDVAHIEFKDGESFNKMPHFNGEAPMLYLRHDGNDMASANVSDDIESISLCFETKAMSRYTLNFNANGSFDYLHLIDRMTGADVDMLIDNEYTFASTVNDKAERFIVKFSYSAEKEAVDNVFAWQNGNDVIVDGAGELQVFDVTGRMVMSTMVNGMETINTTSLQSGVYVFRMLANEVKTQKIVIK